MDIFGIHWSIRGLFPITALFFLTKFSVFGIKIGQEMAEKELLDKNQESDLSRIYLDR